MDIFIGNLPSDTSDRDVRSIFSNYGHVEDIHIIKDKVTGNSLGYGFVIMPENEKAMEAVKALNLSRINGRIVKVCTTPQRIERRKVSVLMDSVR